MSNMPCQVKWIPECLGANAPTTMVRPARFGFKCADSQRAATCLGCKRVMQTRGKEMTSHKENYLLWGVLRTQRLLSRVSNKD